MCGPEPLGCGPCLGTTLQASKGAHAWLLSVLGWLARRSMSQVPLRLDRLFTQTNKQAGVGQRADPHLRGCHRSERSSGPCTVKVDTARSSVIVAANELQSCCACVSAPTGRAHVLPVGQPACRALRPESETQPPKPRGSHAAPPLSSPAGTGCRPCRTPACTSRMTLGEGKGWCCKRLADLGGTAWQLRCCTCCTGSKAQLGGRAGRRRKGNCAPAHARSPPELQPAVRSQFLAGFSGSSHCSRVRHKQNGRRKQYRPAGLCTAGCLQATAPCLRCSCVGLACWRFSRSLTCTHVPFAR